MHWMKIRIAWRAKERTKWNEKLYKVICRMEEAPMKGQDTLIALAGHELT